MAAENEKVVGIEYELRVEGDDQVVDSNMGQKPLEFIFGKGQIIPGLEKELEGLQEGESKEVQVAPDEAYGEYNPEAIQDLPLEQFSGIDLQKGMTLYGQGQNGETVQVVVKDFDDQNVTIDHNHPLAGKNLNFAVTVASVREATDEELANGAVASECCGTEGGHEHGGDSCCGGGCH
ncbi:MAG: FKBP-type peptidyl-prolyl cis-trans isomerase [Campylobacterota bacterium]